MKQTIKVYSDYICPFCFLTKDQLYKAVRDRDVTIEWMPYELRQRPEENLDPVHDPDMLATWDLYVIPLIEEWGVTMNLPKLSPHPYTDKAHEGYLYARDFGRGEEYHNSVSRAFFIEGKNIGDVEVLAEIAENTGLDREAFTRALSENLYSREEKALIHHANENEMINVVPTIIIDDIRLEGTASQEIIEEAMELAGIHKVV